jgi:inner membrane protein
LDNLTHTLLGLMAGEAVARSTPPAGRLSDEARRTLYVATGVTGGNLPDLDLLTSFGHAGGGADAGGLAYLLFHRGHTHTVVGCLALALLLWLALLAVLRWRRVETSGADRARLAGFCGLSVLLHLGMDGLNSYGVHPFWPFDDRWYYGDAVFIIEPLYWLAAAPLLWSMRSRFTRVGLTLVIAVGVALNVFLHRTQPAWWLAVGAATLVLAVAGRRTGARGAAFLAAGAAVSVTLTFIVAGHAAARQVQDLARREFPGAETLDHVLSPLPTDPTCWDLLLVQREAGELVVRHGLLTGAGGIARACRPLLPTSGLAPLTPVRGAVRPTAVRWLGETATSEARLAQLAAGHCAVREMLQFVRAPFVAELRGEVVVGDLRFDREPGLGMAKLPVRGEDTAACVPRVPWLPPRADSLGLH